MLKAAGFQEKFWNPSRTWPGQRPEQDDSGHSGHNRRDAPLDCLDAFVRLAQRNGAGMDQPRGVLHVRMQLRQAS
jgi:hypothetical protein